MINVEAIKEMFIKNGVTFQETSLLKKLEEERFPNEVNSYLRLMKTPIRLHVSSYGTALTHLMSQEEIIDEYYAEENQSIYNNNCLIIGYGPNGDYLCISLKTGMITYVFHDMLWEQPDEAFDEISITMDIRLDQLLEMAFNSTDYPCDGFSAEEYMNRNT